ncbi:MAG TPA: hypothetical protein EYH06_01855 [Chromatiales bacterium]|nr:hypothetical protein [Thiotrichales bacterium]HIP67318.1 hypothetical protein [Chromatiales bacterium]
MENMIMTTQVTTKERLSALFDDELTEFENRRLTSELLTNAEHKMQWLRYQMIGDVMRGGLGSQVDTGFTDRVMQTIHAEETYSTPVEKINKPRPWVKPVAGLAMAASVAAVSIFALQFMTQSGTNTAVNVANTSEVSTPAGIQQVAVQKQGEVLAELPKAPATDNSLVRQVNTADIQPLGEIQNIPLSDPRMDSYLATHAEYASRPGMLSRVRIVGYGSPDKEER